MKKFAHLMHIANQRRQSDTKKKKRRAEKGGRDDKTNEIPSSFHNNARKLDLSSEMSENLLCLA